MLLLGQATPNTDVWIVSTDPFVCVTIEPPLFAPGLQNSKAFTWVPPGDGYPDTALILRMAALYAHDVESTAAPTAFDIVQGSTDPAHTPPEWLVCDSPHGVEPVWTGLIHTASPVAVIEHGVGDFLAKGPLVALRFPPAFPGDLLIAGTAAFDLFHQKLAAMPPPPSAEAPTPRRF